MSDFQGEIVVNRDKPSALRVAQLLLPRLSTNTHERLSFCCHAALPALKQPGGISVVYRHWHPAHFQKGLHLVVKACCVDPMFDT